MEPHVYCCSTVKYELKTTKCGTRSHRLIVDKKDTVIFCERSTMREQWKRAGNVLAACAIAGGVARKV